MGPTALMAEAKSIRLLAELMIILIEYLENSFSISEDTR